ncbi:sensor histidine kinase [Azohydromonas australica]|uniref:sensor histidine kinase n=1 Tax=Azohydromonas australica TaxID=364039 RepID=UPI00041EB497|nr:CHASE domain-containing protein [Azohydromonas australica]
MVLLLGIVGAAAAGAWQYRFNQAVVDERLHAVAERLADQLRRRMRTYEYGVLGMRSAILAGGDGVGRLSADAFRRYEAGLDMAHQYPGARAFAFIRRVPADQEAAFVAAMRQQGLPDFQVRGIEPNPGERFVAQYVAPRRGNEAAFGFDMASDPRRRAATLAALRSGEPRLTAPVTLPHQAQDLPTQAYVLVLPVYRGANLPAPELRESLCIGWAAGSMVMSDVLRDFLEYETLGQAVALRDTTDPDLPVAAFTAPEWVPGARLATQHVSIDLYGRQWQVEVQAVPDFMRRLGLRHPLSLTASVAAAALLLALLLYASQDALTHKRSLREERSRILELNATLEQQVVQRTRALEIAAARERAIVSSAATAVIAMDLEGHITAFNPAAEAMFRCPASEALGSLVTDFCEPGELRYKARYFPPDVSANARWLPAALREGLLSKDERPSDRPHNEWTYVRADGSAFPGLLSISVLRDEAGRSIGFLAVIADLSERKAIEEALRRYTAELEAVQAQLQERTRQAEAASRAKSAFLANMSHEFRTPLNAVIGLSQLLEQRTLPDDIGRFVRHIRQAGEQLLALTNDVLDLSRIEAGEMRLECVPFELVPLLDAVHAIVHPQALSKGLSLKMEFSTALPARLCGDPLRIRQVLLNLLGNSVKFTSQGGVKLHVHAVAREAGRITLRLEVSDSGIGIDPAQQARIFEPFTQADGSITRRFGGTGLGLSIVRRLVEMMDGQLELKSAPGQGSIFSVTLTLDLLQEPA